MIFQSLCKKTDGFHPSFSCNKTNIKSKNTFEKVIELKFVLAFVIGGLICVVGQILIDKTGLTPAKILVAFVVLGVVLHGVGLYQPLVDLAGAGATVPLTGFGYTLAKGTAEAVNEQGFPGVISGPLTAGAAGITTALLSGLVVSCITGSKDK